MGIFQETTKINITEVIDDLKHCTYDLNDKRALDHLMEQIGDAKYVLLGESTHGTHEYYLWRTKISQRLIEEKGFSFIAVEGDWPDCFKINQFVKGSAPDQEINELIKTFNRWPTWMWGNWETVALASWLKSFNKSRSKNKVGFYGLDLYSLWESLENLMLCLEPIDSKLYNLAKEAYACFKPYESDEGKHFTSYRELSASCRTQVISLHNAICKTDRLKNQNSELVLNLIQNAELAVSAELYYRSLSKSGPSAWNIRDRHMMDTLSRVSDFYGPNSKGIIWEHNTHIGDARATDMPQHGRYNLGQLIREQHGQSQAILVGFGTYKGSLMAAYNWGEPMVEMNMPQARADSWEALLHAYEPSDKLLILNKLKNKEPFNLPINHRAVGVIYDPKQEKTDNYVPSIIPDRYDAFLFIDETSVIHALNIKADEFQIPETYPWKE